MKLGTEINHYQTIAENKNNNATYIFCELSPLSIYKYGNFARSIILN